MWVPITRSWALTRGFALHSGTRNLYEIRYTRTQHRPASRQVNDHGRVSGTHSPGLGLAQPARYRESSERFVVAFRHHRRLALPLLLANFLADAPVGGFRVTACWLLARLLIFLLPEL